MNEAGLPVCIEMCIRALRMQSDDGNTKPTVCKTIACLLPNDLEVKRACQLTEFLLEPTVDSYYAVETLYNEPDQKMEEENMPVPNSLRCELLLVFKTQWPFDPEFWDWKTLKRQCLALMGEEASIVSSIDLLNDTDEAEEEEARIDDGFLESAERMVSGIYELTDTMDRKQKNREMKKLREKGFISARFRNWQAYMQYCVLCDKEFLGHRIIRHAQTHFNSGVYSCPICAESFTSKDTLIPHVTSHVKQSCKDRLTAMKTNKKLANPKTAAPVIAALIAKTENEVSENAGAIGQNAGSLQNVQLRLSGDNNEENVCPVGTCKKTFKFYRNLIAHVKAHGDNEEAMSYLEMRSKKVVCQYCRRHFVNVNHLNDHLQVHCGAKPYICIQLNCKASFLSNAELLVHRKTHTSFKARCMFPNCGKIFSEAFKLYDHEAHHYKTFTCKFVDCGKVFHTQQQLDCHHTGHTIKKEQEVAASEQNLQSCPSVTAQSIPDQHPRKEPDNYLEKCNAESVSVSRPETLESLLKVSQTPIETVDRYEIKDEAKDQFSVSQTSQIVSNSVIQPTNLQPTKSHVKKETSYSLPPDYLKPSLQNQQHASPFEATINKMLREKTVLQSQLQIFSNVNSGAMNYTTVPACSASVQTIPTVTQMQALPMPAMLQARPPTEATSTANQVENPPNPPACTVLKERYHCAYETCTRNYSCYKSVAKHMKTSHAEFYAIRKIPRAEIKVTYVSGPPLVPKPMGVTPQENQQRETLQGAVRQNVIQSPPYTNVVTNFNTKSHPPTTVNQNASLLMENVLNPIVVSQLKNTPNQPNVLQTQGQPTWSPDASQRHPPRPANSAPLQPIGSPCIQTHVATDSSQDLTTATHPLQSQIKTQGQPMWSVPSQNHQILNSTTYQKYPTRPLEATSASLPPNGPPCIPTALDPNHLTDMQSSTALPPKIQSEIQVANQLIWSPPPQIKQVPHGDHTKIHPTRPMVPTSTSLPPMGPLGILMDSNQIAVNAESSCQSLYGPAPANASLPPEDHSKTQETHQPIWSPVPQSKQISAAGLPHILPKRPEKSTNAPLPTTHPSCINVETNNNALVSPASCMQSRSQPLLASKTKEKCQAASLSALQRVSRDSENTKRMHKPALSNVQSSKPHQGPPTSGNKPENVKPPRKGRRTKWPAIIRDGKYICSLCYREFNSSTSLGGHLSKRTACKPFELNTDLPTSFLDFLNSEQTVSNIQSNRPHNPLAVHCNKPLTSKTQGSLEQKSYSSQNLPAHINGETNDDILKEIMTASNMSDLFVQPQAPQIQKPSGTYGPGFTTCSVIRPVEGHRRDVGSHNTHFPQSRLPGNRCPTPLLSQVLKENQTSTAATSVPVISPSKIHYHTEGAAADSNLVTPTTLPESWHSPATNDSNQPERKSTEQEIKRKLRNQILAGDFQRRINLCHLASAEINIDSQSPMSCSSESCSKSEKNQMIWDATGYSENGENTAIIPGTSAEIKELLKSQSFTCLRQICISEQDSQSPITTGLSDNGDNEPQQLSSSQQQWFAEIQTAFERLNLTREAPEAVSESITPNTSLGCLNIRSKVMPGRPRPLAGPKILACDAENCAYNTISTEAFWRHLYKTHGYTFEQVNAVKKRYGQYAPFQCQKCNKTFTRNPNLKTHYITAHQLSTEEIKELDMKRKNDRAAMIRLIQKQSPGIKRTLPASENELLLQNINQALLQKPANPGCTSVIQALPTVNLPSVALKCTEQGKMTTLGHGTGGPQRNVSSGLLPNGGQPVAHLPQTEVPPHLAKGPLTPGKQVNRQPDKKPKSSGALSQYRPYRCVHQGCEAAFTIQHNLILHYRAIHQSALSALEVNEEQDQNEATDEVKNQEEEGEEEEVDVPHISEFRCQVKDCSRVFQQVPLLMQHYLRLHEFRIDKVGDLLSGISLGRFTCGHQGCTVSFTAFWKYVAHIKELHKDVKLSKPESLYKCEIEGCDRAYATKSNMLRHFMKKHQDIYLLKRKLPSKSEDGVKQNLKTLQYQLNKTSDGKENIESNKTSPQKDANSKRPRKINNYWTKYENPVLKSNVEAAAMCTKSYPLQYPCMIKGCESVMNSEKSILKHYTVHGLSEKFLEQHRSHYIFCKKFPRQKNGSIRSDDSKSDHSSESEPELTADAGMEQTQSSESKPFLRKRTSPVIPAGLIDGLSNDDSSDGSVVMKRKRGRPRRIIEKIVKHRKMFKPTESRGEGSDSSTMPSEDKGSDESVPLASFKPMGFEMSFLKFLEQSNKTQPSITCDIPMVGPWVRLSQLNTKETCVRFSNRQNLKSLDKVKIVVDKSFLGVTDLMLKQLQDMQPTVILEKK